MKAVVCESWRPFNELEIKDIDSPKLVSDYDVLIQIIYNGVGWATTLTVEGKYQRKPPLPFTPGTDVSGIVVEVGSKVTHAKVGDRVCAVLDYGGYAEQVVVHERHVFKLPNDLSLAQSVALPTSYMTAYGAFFWRGKLTPGMIVLIHGAAGGVGLAAVDIALSLGCTVYAVVRGDDKVSFLKSRGCKHVIDSSKESFKEVMKELTGGAGVNLVIDPIGGDVLDDSLRCLADDGKHIVIGFVQGTISQIPANILLLKNISVSGFYLGQYMGWGVIDERVRYAPMFREGMTKLISWMQEGRIDPVICEKFAFEDYKEAMKMVLGRKSIGRVVLQIGDEPA